MSESEKLLWAALRGKAIRFRVKRQHPVDKYCLDFFVHEAMLCVEVDGEFHRLRAVEDAQRDADLAAMGIETLRIPSLDLWANLPYWVDEVYFRCCARSGRKP